jgi:exoribonuclease-2
MLMAGEAVAQWALGHGIPIPFSTQEPPRMEERPTDVAGMYALRRASQPSQPSTKPRPHAGLGLAVYAQSTSPLRRYPDLLVHQQLCAHLRGEATLEAQAVLERVNTAAAAMMDLRQAERLSRRHWTLVYLLEHPDWVGQGILVEKQRLRGIVLIPELDLEATVHLGHELALNSTVPLALRTVDLPELTAQFQVLA